MKPEEQRQLIENTAAPIGELIASIGQGIGEAQQALDEGSSAVFQSMYAQDNSGHSLSELAKMGYQPTWYQIPETNAEIKLSMNLSQSKSDQGKSQFKMYGTPVDASYANKFNYNVSLSSKVSFKVVPVPPPSKPQTPNLVGMKVSQASGILDALGLPFALSQEISEAAENDFIIQEQKPEAGYLLGAEQNIELTVKKG